MHLRKGRQTKAAEAPPRPATSKGPTGSRKANRNAATHKHILADIWGSRKHVRGLRFSVCKECVHCNAWQRNPMYVLQTVAWVRGQRIKPPRSRTVFAQANERPQPTSPSSAQPLLSAFCATAPVDTFCRTCSRCRGFRSNGLWRHTPRCRKRRASCSAMALRQTTLWLCCLSLRVRKLRARSACAATDDAATPSFRCFFGGAVLSPLQTRHCRFHCNLR